VAYHVQNVE